MISGGRAWMDGGYTCAGWPSPWSSSCSLPPGPVLQLPRRPRARAPQRSSRAHRTPVWPSSAGRATGEMPESGDVVFAVDRWFHGPHAARVVRLLDSSAYVVEPPTAGVIQATLAKTVSGDAIQLVRDQPVLMVAAWDPASGMFGAQACGLAGVPLDSAEGPSTISAAVAFFGPGRPAVKLPSTDTLDPGRTRTSAAPGGASDWRPIVLLFALGAGFLLARRRIAG